MLLLFYSYSDPRDLHSFPTRRSSDLSAAASIRLKMPTACLPSTAPCRTSHRLPYTRSKERSTSGRPTRSRACLVKARRDRKSTRLNSSHVEISYAVFCLKKKKKTKRG